MFRLKIVLLFMVMCVFGYAQENTKKYTLGAHFSLDANYRTLSRNYDEHDLETTEHIIKFRNEEEKMLFGFGSGINLLLNLNSSLDFIFSPRYALKGYQVQSSNLLLINDNVDGFTSAGNLHIKYRYHFIDFPLQIAYNFKVKNTYLFVSAGLEANLFLATYAHLTHYSDDGEKKKSKEEEIIEDRRTITPSVIVSSGVTLDFKNHQKLRIEPMFRYQVLKFNQSPITEQLWNTGLNITYYFL